MSLTDQIGSRRQALEQELQKVEAQRLALKSAFEKDMKAISLREATLKSNVALLGELLEPASTEEAPPADSSTASVRLPMESDGALEGQAPLTFEAVPPTNLKRDMAINVVLAASRAMSTPEIRVAVKRLYGEDSWGSTVSNAMTFGVSKGQLRRVAKGFFEANR